MEEKIKYYAVETKCGHVGRKNFIRVTYGVQAISKKEAAQIGRRIPRVKHDHKDAILGVKEISYEEYLTLNKVNKNDIYLQVHSKQDQNYYCAGLSARLEQENEDSIELKRNREERLIYKKKKYLSALIGDKYSRHIIF